MPKPESQNRRFRRAFVLLKTLVSFHPGLFAVSMAGAAVFAVCTVASSWALRWVIDEVIVTRFATGVISVKRIAATFGLLVGLSLIRAVGVVIRRTWAGKAQWRTAESLTAQVVDALVDQPVSWHRQQSTGDLITRAGVDCEASVAVLAPLPYASSVLLMMVIAATGLISTDIWLGIAATSVFPLLILLNVMYQRRVDRWFDLAQDELGSLSAAVHESFEGVTVVKAFGAELQETNRLATIASRVKVARIEAIKLRSLFVAGLDFVPNLTNICLVVGGSFRVRSGDLSVGELASCIYMFTLLVFPLRLIGYAFSEMPRSQSGFARLRSLLDQEILADPRRKINESEGGLTLTDVSVGHNLDKDVLAGVSASFKIGSITAIVGYTGSGKTTLLHAMAGLIEISNGVISGSPDATALVFQEPFVVGSSVLDNITMGHEYRDEEVTRAIEIAEAQFLFELPSGLQTIVGERGVGLSGGQRQRLALARAVITSPRVLLLDDTTSALDPLTESKVMGNLRRELGETTVIAVSSRPSIIALSDEVIFVADGGIVDQRPHQELLLCSASYRQLMQAYEQDREES